MAKFDKDSFSGTLIVVVAVSLVCSVVVAGAAVGLKPMQTEKRVLDKQRNILGAAGLLKADTDVPKLYAERVEPRVVDLASGDYVDNIENFDARVAAKDPQQSVRIDPEQDLAGIQTRA